MKTMKSYYALIGAVTLATATSSFATLIPGTGTVSTTVGLGDFVAVSTPTTGPNLGTFETFCLNSNVQLPHNQVFNYALSDSGVPGGSGINPTPDPISIGTAWLYSQFHQGLLGGNLADNKAIQQAIWWLEGDGQPLGQGVYNSMITLAEQTLFGGTGGIYDTMVQGNANGAYGVEVMNLVRTSYQPLLVVVPEPSTVVAGALLLLPFGVSTLRILRKKQTS